MPRHFFERNRGQRDDRERYADDERDLSWNRDSSGYGAAFRGDDRERARGWAGEGFYDPGDEYAQTGFREAAYRAYPGRDAPERNRYEPQWDAGRRSDEYGHPDWNQQPAGRSDYARQLGYGSERRWGAREQFQGQYRDTDPYARQPRYAGQESSAERGRFDFRSARERQQRLSHYGRGPRGYKRSDDRIREDVSDRFFQDHEIDAREIELRVSEGIVTLEGTVENRYIKRLAEDVAESVLGVEDVINHLRVKREEEGATAAVSGAGDNGGQKARSAPNART
jgi:osmotically-inducible protein OsmY